MKPPLAVPVGLLAASLAVPAGSQVRPDPMKTIAIPLRDFAADTARQTVVDRESGQYLGHPTTVLLEDGKTILCVYPKGHGRGPICLKKSLDGGRTWSGRLPVPENWSTSLETPTIYRTVDRGGVRRLVLFSGLFPIRTSISTDDGASWTPLAPVGDWGGIVAMSSLVKLKNGDDLALFHDDGRFFRKDGAGSKAMTLYQSRSADGGLTWSQPASIFSSEAVHLCEPGAVRSPDGKEIALLLRENRRVRNSHLMVSRDEGAHWSEPREMPAALTGDRHTAKYLADGRLFISFRDMAADSPTKGDWVAWVGTFEDIVGGREGEFRVRIMDNKNSWDCAYPGVEVLPDGTVVTTTYGHWTEGQEPYVVAVRFDPKDLRPIKPIR